MAKKTCISISILISVTPKMNTPLHNMLFIKKNYRVDIQFDLTFQTCMQINLMDFSLKIRFILRI